MSACMPWMTFCAVLPTASETYDETSCIIGPVIDCMMCSPVLTSVFCDVCMVFCVVVLMAAMSDDGDVDDAVRETNDPKST